MPSFLMLCAHLPALPLQTWRSLRIIRKSVPVRASFAALPPLATRFSFLPSLGRCLDLDRRG